MTLPPLEPRSSTLDAIDNARWHVEHASPEHIAGIVRGMVDAYLLKAEKVIADGGRGRE